MTFKVGDKVRRIKCFYAQMRPGDIRVVHSVDGVFSGLKFKDDDHAYDPAFFELVEEPKTIPQSADAPEAAVQRQPHKHAELIKAWADGAKIQLLSFDKWYDITNTPPAWSVHVTYRVKPEPKPDAVLCASVWMTDANLLAVSGYSKYPDVQFTFDSETNKLKSVSLINTN